TAILKLPKQARRYSDLAVQTAADTGNRFALAQAMVFRAFVASVGGDPVETLQLLNEALDRGGQWLDTLGFVNAVGPGTQICLLRGHFKRAFEWVELGFQRMRLAAGSGKLLDSHVNSVVEFYLLSTQGRHSEAQKGFDRYKEVLRGRPHDVYGRVVYYACLLSALHEQGELGAPAEDAISNFRKLGLKPKLTQNLLRGFWVNQAYFRVAQCLADHLAGRTLRLESLRDAIRELKEAEFTDLVRCNRLVAEAALLLFEAKHETALKRLTQAERLAAKPEVDCALAIFEIARLRAHLFTWMKNPRALHEARFALELAIEQGWVNRQRWIESEFGIKAATAGLPSPSASISSGSITLKRHLDSLLRVSLTAGTVLDPQLQAKAVLDEIVELLGAERGFLFLVNEKTGNLEMRAGRSSEKTDLEELKGYSSTVVNKVHQDRKTIVVTGTEEGAVLGSQSAVIHGLKSIMAAPLLLKDSALGVVYLDSRVAKGIFTSDDVEILAALSNHLAIALEIARNTRLEMERQALKKDLEITGAVQALLLPRETVFRNAHLKLAGFYRSASQSGGDWWCHQELPDGAVRILMGDVTGHGAGPAMVTAIAAATHESASRFAGHSTAPEVLRALHENLARLCRGSYLMTMGAVEISPAERRVRFWTAGAPPVFLVTPGAVNVKTLIERGTPLGSTEFNIGHVEAEFSPGDRLFLFTDCAYEMHVGESGKTLGMRQLSKLFLKLSTETPRSEVETLRGRLTETFDATLGNVPQDDDLTFVVVEHT
ncbi:MAG: PP2C family protein-serine/threonine phosphatase, partial [Bdellovibrionota bacterium]